MEVRLKKAVSRVLKLEDILISLNYIALESLIIGDLRVPRPAGL